MGKGRDKKKKAKTKALNEIYNNPAKAKKIEEEKKKRNQKLTSFSKVFLSFSLLSFHNFIFIFLLFKF